MVVTFAFTPFPCLHSSLSLKYTLLQLLILPKNTSVLGFHFTPVVGPSTCLFTCISLLVQLNLQYDWKYQREVLQCQDRTPSTPRNTGMRDFSGIFLNGAGPTSCERACKIKSVHSALLNI